MLDDNNELYKSFLNKRIQLGSWVHYPKEIIVAFLTKSNAYWTCSEVWRDVYLFVKIDVAVVDMVLDYRVLGYPK